MTDIMKTGENLINNMSYDILGFGHMAKQLMQLANGKLVLVLEGGYDLPSICDASEICVGALLGDDIKPIREEEMRRPPHESAMEAMQTTIKCQGGFHFYFILKIEIIFQWNFIRIVFVSWRSDYHFPRNRQKIYEY